jgi:hypothetical protein
MNYDEKHPLMVYTLGTLMLKLTVRCIQMSIVCLGIANSCYGMVYDNRFVPLFERVRLKQAGLLASWTFDTFLGTASIGVDDNNSQQEIGIPEIYGRLDEGQLGTACTTVGKVNPIPMEWLSRPIPLKVDGKQQIEGITFSCYQPFCNCFVIGGSMVFMRVNARHEFRIRDKADLSGFDSLGELLSSDDRMVLDAALRQMFNELSLRENASVQTGMGDIDFFVGMRDTWNFTCKFRRVDADVRLGVYLPSGLRRSIDAPASIPFGGDGHWGIYADTQWLFELKEDMKVGLIGRVIKRLPRTLTERISVGGEPLIFGAEVGSAHRNPGITYVFSPYIALEHLRQGLGVSLRYTLLHHRQDNWSDRRLPSQQEAIPGDFVSMKRYSGWGEDYFTLSALYELNWLVDQEYLVPTLSVRWDIPATLWVAGLSTKTHLLSAGIEFSF